MSDKKHDYQLNNSEQELQEIPLWLKSTLSVISLLSIFAGLLTIILYVGSSFSFLNFDAPKPVETEATTMIAVGSLILILLYLPWSKIKFGEFELERVLGDQTQEYSLYIDELKEKLERRTQDSTKETPNDKDRAEDQIEKLLLKFLRKWSSYGFTISRIINWGGNRDGFEHFKNINNMELRLIADKLVREGKIRTRISSSGNILYQIK